MCNMLETSFDSMLCNVFNKLLVLCIVAYIEMISLSFCGDWAALLAILFCFVSGNRLV